MIRIAVTADDYGLSPGVSKAIIALANAGRLSGTACMTVFPWWPEQAYGIAPLLDQIDVGVHLTLTDHAPLDTMPVLAPSGRMPSPVHLYRRAVIGAIDPAEIKSELNRQIDAFEDALGRPPAFLDSHHHAHQFPQIRDVVISVFLTRLSAQRAYMRCCWDSPARIFKRGVHPWLSLGIALSGRALAKRAAQCGVPLNRGFSGVHKFSTATNYGALFNKFLRHQVDGGMIMCHPGIVDDQLAQLDTVVETRENEFGWLASDAMPQAMAAANSQIFRLSEILHERAKPADYSRSRMKNVTPHDKEVENQTGTIGQKLR
ncbi:MAG: hypothetical protein CMF67_10920 [Magnetovibrio sp.]|nr:hypothetical protein [Magnetovibrio sp.]|tara:strand:+ start:3407 stop:4357 length:951 start_codon:yes stop_codon:yes gene_type:complete